MKSRHGALRLTVAGVGLFFVVAFVLTSAYDTWHQREQLLRTSDRELSNLSKALAEETARSVQNVDILLRDTAAWFAQGGRHRDPAEIERVLAAMTLAAPQVTIMTIVDAQGHQRHRSQLVREPLANVADRPYFQVQRDRADVGLFINKPIVTRTEGTRALVVSRRINGPGERFDGVVTAIVTLEQLRQTYDRIDLGDRSELFLAFDDGTPIVSSPPMGTTRQLPLRELGLSLQDGEAARMRSEIDGRMKAVAAADVRGLPLVVALTRDETEILASWQAEARNAFLRALAVGVLALLAIGAIDHQLRRGEDREQALRQSEQRYAMAMDAANEGHAEWSLRDDTVFLSAHWRRMHGLAPHEEFSFSALREALPLHPQDRLMMRQALDDHLAGGTASLEVEYRVRDDAAGWRWIQARGRALRDEAGGVTHLFWATSDVTHRKKAEEERLQMEAQLQRSQHLESLGTMAGGIAHDFNNILGAILGYGEMALREVPPASAPQRHLERVMQAGLRAKALVRRIIDFSRSGYGERALVEVQAVVEEALAMLAPTLPSGVSLHSELQAPHKAVLCEVSQLHQVVMNLCTNAAHAIEGSGELHVALDFVERAAHATLSHGTVAPGSYVRLRVRDTGSGIAPAVFERMFDPFYTTRSVGEGTGLGLSVVHGVVADLGGAIDVATRVGEGSTFTIWLPSASDTADAGPSDAHALPKGNGDVVMVVDDEPALVSLTEEMLAALGYEPVGYTDSARAAAAFAERPERFDLVLTDALMPGMSGLELIAQLRARRPDLPVVLMTGFGGTDLDGRADAAAVDALLHKPLLARDLAECLATVLHPSARARFV